MASQPLPVEYTPMSSRTLAEGQTFGLSFRVHPSSHDKTLSGLLESVGAPLKPEAAYSCLLPSELWAMARVLSSVFGRLNELVLARTAWAMHGTTAPGAPLQARTVVGRIRKGRMPICTTHTDTFTESGVPLVHAVDDILLTHDCAKPFFVERSIASPPAGDPLLYRAVHRVYCRFEWDPLIWVNNIHTDEYARQCGFDRGLPEFPVYMDWIYHAAVQAGWLRGGPFSIKLRKILPIYTGDVVEVIAYQDGDSLQVRFLKDGADRLVATVAGGAEPPPTSTLVERAGDR
jgi:hypothetical protein